MRVELHNEGSETVFLGLPSESQKRWPFTYGHSLEANGELGVVGRTVCACPHEECRLCATPVAVVALPPGASKSWVLTFEDRSMKPGRAEINVELEWYGSVSRDSAHIETMKASEEIALLVKRIPAGCVDVTRLKP
jgi:hypothetical protein